MDYFTFVSLKQILIGDKQHFMISVKTVVYDNALYLQSKQFFDGVPYFIMKIFSDLKYEAFHLSVKV